MFKLFDREGDGQIESTELGNVLWALGLQPTKAEVQELLMEMDTDKSETVDLEEFLLVMARKLKEERSKDEVEETFDLMDKDNDGVIGREDLAVVLAFLGEKVADRKLEAMMEEVQDDGLGMKEFKRITGDIWR